MAHKFESRLRAIEAALVDDRKAAEWLADAQSFTDRINALAERFTDADRFLSKVERVVRFSPAMELSWSLRFGTDAEYTSALDVAAAYVQNDEAARTA